MNARLVNKPSTPALHLHLKARYVGLIADMISSLGIRLHRYGPDRQCSDSGAVIRCYTVSCADSSWVDDPTDLPDAILKCLCELSLPCEHLGYY